MRSKSIGLVALVTLAAVVPLTVADHDVYSDEFADGTQDWSSKGSAQWQVINGQLGGVLWGKNNVNNSTASIAFAGKAAWDDYRLKVEVMRIGNNTTNPWVGVAWRNDWDKGHYLLALRDGEYFFGKPDLAGGFTTLQTWTPLSWLDADKWNEVRIVADGDDHSFFLNGATLAEHIDTVTDNTTGKGSIGVAVGPGAQAVFDNAHVVTLVDRVDTLAPMVSITDPVEDAVLGSAVIVENTMTLTIDANDTAESGNESGLDTIRVYLDGKLAGTKYATGATTYAIDVDLRRASLGNHDISVVVSDKAHHRAYAHLDILVVNVCVSTGPGMPTCLP